MATSPPPRSWQQAQEALALFEALGDTPIVAARGGEALQSLPRGGVGGVDGDGALVLQARRDGVALRGVEEVAELHEQLRAIDAA